MVQTSWLLSAFFATVLIARSLSAAEGLYLVVTPERQPGGRGGGFGCEVRPESEPPSVKDDAVRLLVTLEGSTTMPVRWRLPLYKANNGANDIAVARVGEGKPDKGHHFVIRVTAADLTSTDGLDEFRLELRTHDGREATCSIKAEPLRVAVRRAPPAESTPGSAFPESLRLNGAVER